MPLLSSGQAFVIGDYAETAVFFMEHSIRGRYSKIKKQQNLDCSELGKWFKQTSRFFIK